MRGEMIGVMERKQSHIDFMDVDLCIGEGMDGQNCRSVVEA